MKRKLANILNRFLRLFGLSIYKSGFDMECSLLELKTEPFNTVIDIGASNGKWGIYALRIFKHARVFAVEPLKEHQTALKKLSNRSTRFNYVIVAAGDGFTKTVELMVTEDLDGSTVSGNQGVPRAVPSMSLDQIVANKQLKAPFFLKFDTHGFESAILKGCPEVLKNTQVILMEMYNFRLTNDALLFYEMIEHLSDKGFRVYNIVEPLKRPKDKVLWQLDVILLRKQNDIFRSCVYE